MSNRRRLRRETLEYYLVYLILMYRRLIWICGLLFLGYAIAATVVDLFPGSAILLLPAVFLLLLSNSYTVALYTARVAAWLGTLWIRDE